MQQIDPSWVKEIIELLNKKSEAKKPQMDLQNEKINSS